MTQKIWFVRIPIDQVRQEADANLQLFLNYIGRTAEGLLDEGDQLKTDVFRDSNLIDITIPAPLPQSHPSTPALVAILAVLVHVEDDIVVDTEVIGQMRIYDAHMPIPNDPEETFGDILNRYRSDFSNQMMVYFGELATNRHKVRGTSTIKGIYREGLIYALEQECARAVATINPNRVPHYQEYMGFQPISEARYMKMVNALGVLICTSQEEINIEYFLEKKKATL